MSRVIIVDDDQGTLVTFQAILRLGGYEVATAASGLEALEIARRRAADLLLADLLLPDMSGVDVLRSLRAEQMEIPVVIMTAFASVGSAVDALKLGASDYVEKPLDDARLLDIVRQVVGGQSNSPSPWLSLAPLEQAPAQAYSPPVAAARAFIEEHYRERLTYGVIGRALGRDPEHLEEQFREECGITLRGYQREVRLRKAYQLAEAGDKIESLPESVGFGSKSGLLRAFRRMFGRTPGSVAGSSKTRTPGKKERSPFND